MNISTNFFSESIINGSLVIGEYLASRDFEIRATKSCHAVDRSSKRFQKKILEFHGLGNVRAKHRAFLWNETGLGRADRTSLLFSGPFSETRDKNLIEKSNSHLGKMKKHTLRFESCSRLWR